jgi:hypothetical protein
LREHVPGSDNYVYGLANGHDGEPDSRTAASFFKTNADKCSIFSMYHFAQLLGNENMGQAFPEESLRFYKTAA